MIERNLGNIERVVRLVLALACFGWLSTRPDVNGMELFVGLVGVALVLNGVFCRCYLWYLLDISTASDSGDGRGAAC